MTYNTLVLRLKNALYISTEVIEIKRELRGLTHSQKSDFFDQLKREKYKSDYAQINKVMPEIIKSASPF